MQLYAQPYRSKALEPFTPKYPLQRSQIEDLRLAASKLLGATRRSFQAEMCLKYCGGSARLAETIFSWGRNNVELGLAEKRTGITCKWSASGPRGKQELGRTLSRGGSQFTSNCRSSRTARSEFSDNDCLHSFNSGRSNQATATAGIY